MWRLVTGGADTGPPDSAGASSGRAQPSRGGIVEWLFTTREPQTPEVRRLLLATAVDRKGALAVASASIVATCLTAIWATDAKALWPFLWMAAELTLTGIRMRVILRSDAHRKVETMNLPVMLAVGVTWCLVFGLGCLACLLSGHAVLGVLAGMNVAGVAAATATRLAALPRYANLAITLCGLPFALGAGYLGGEMLSILVLMPVWTTAITVLTFQNHRLLLRVVKADVANRRAALSDRLTGMPNRMYLEEELDSLCRRLDGESRFALLSLDLDGFKGVNDEFGHAAGDLLLKAVGGRIQNTVREQDNACRLGGDEFVVVLPNAGADEAGFIAKRIIAAIDRPFDIGLMHQVRVGISVGSVTAPEYGTSPEQLLAAADQALYAAKRDGKGIHRTYASQSRRGLNALTA